MAEDKNKKIKNFFEKIYKNLENSYFSMSSWFTKKGVNLNKLNSILEKKGVPAFPVVVSTLLLFLILIIFLIVLGLNHGVELTIGISDYDGRVLDNVNLTIVDSLKNKEIFSGLVNNSDVLNVPLSIGKEYNFKASTNGYKNYKKTVLINNKNEEVNIRFEEDYEKGYLTIHLLDFDSKKVITSSRAVINYYADGNQQSLDIESDSDNKIQALVPIDKELDITVISDGYENKNFTHILTSEQEEITEYLNIDVLSFEGTNSKLNIMVVDSDGNPIPQAIVSIYNSNSEMLGFEQSDDFGKVQFDVETGQNIRFTVSKENYSTFDSDITSESYRMVLSEHNYTVVLEIGGSNLKVNVRDTENNLPLENSIVNIYNLKNNLIDTNNTSELGNVNFTGLDEDGNYILTICREEYLCKQEFINLAQDNEINIDLEKLSLDNSSKLSIWVYNSFNEPIDKANVLVYKVDEDQLIPTGIGSLEVDISGYTYCNLKLDETYKIIAIVGDSNVEQTITITSFSDNKVILIIDDFSRIIQLQLVDETGNEITSGHLLVKSKLGDILYDGNIDGTTSEFYSEGYNDLIIDHTSSEGVVTTFTAKVGEDKLITIQKQKLSVVNGTYPIIDFVGVEDSLGQRTKFITPNKDYYLIFNVVFPSSAKAGGVHIRAGIDSQNDSENMNYGITGFSADTTNFKYSTTYNPLPIPGMSSIDYLNIGSSEELNKWIELDWKSVNGNIGEKQIKIKVKSIDSVESKLYFNYRVWTNESGKVFRDPKDDLLLDNINSNDKQGLYADSKQILVDLFEVPATCENDFCVSYRFLDSDGFDYSTDDFFAVKGNVYALEATFFSFKNKEINLEALTSNTSPIISFIEINNRLQFPNNVNLETISELDLSKEKISLNAGLKEKYYIFFVAKQLGNTYISTNVNGNAISTIKDKFNFKIMPEKKMSVELNPTFVLSYGSNLIINIKDQESNEPIENAFIEINNEYNQFISSIKGNSLNGKGGTYIVNQNFNSNKLKLKISAYGYQKVSKELIVADTGLISGPNSVNISIGENQNSGFENILLRNTSGQNITNLRSEVVFIKSVNSLSLDAELGIELLGNSSENIKLYATVDNAVNFTSARAIITIYGLIGNTQVAKNIDVIITKGRVVDNCLTITPADLALYVGEHKGAENTNTIYFENKCSQSIYVTPQVLNTKVGIDNDLEISLPAFNINSGETKEYIINIKNLKDRKSIKSYDYQIEWINPNYILKNTKLNISFFDMDKVLQITPSQLFVPLSQTMVQDPAITYSKFNVRNIGKVPIRDITISNFTEKLQSNLTIEVMPTSKDILRPGESVNITVKYSIKLGNAAIDDVKYLVKGFAPGNNTQVETTVSGIFLMSGAKCLKVLPKTLTYDLVINESKEKRITVTNTCAEAVQVLGFDKTGSQYIQTFGNNKLDFYPTSRVSVIPHGGSTSFVLKITGNEYYESLKTPLQLYARTQSGVPVDSESILFSISVKDSDSAINQDYMQVVDDYIPVCGSDDDSEVNVKFPILTSDCLNDGYCQAYDAGKLLLSKIQELQYSIITASSQIENKVDSTECDTRVTNKNYCSISEVNSDIKPVEFDLYLQNDNVSVDLLNELLRLDKASKNPVYKNINNFMVEVNTGSQSMGGISFVGNKIRLASNLYGCGKYHVTIDGAIAANYDQLMPTRAYYYIDVEGPFLMPACTKNIENFLLFLPLDRELNASRPLNTWLTRFTGNKTLGPKLAKNVFNNKSRFVKVLSAQSKSNSLNVSVGKIIEDESALAKISFDDKITSSKPKIEKINVVINEDFKVKNELPENFVKESTKIVSNILNKNEFADVCISPNKDYLLVLSLLDLGDLSFDILDRNPKVEIKDDEFCKDFIIKSSISENIILSNTKIENLDVSYVMNNTKSKKLNFALIAGKPEKLSICFNPKTNLINTLVGQKIKVTATSRYRAKGKIGQRKISKELLFTSCGITPIDFFDKLNSKTKTLSLENKDSAKYFALIDWTKSYNTQNKEEFCKTLEKYNKENPKSEFFFTQIASCNIESSTSFGKTKTDRALRNSATYFGSCFLTCAACNGFGNILINSISVIGTANLIKDLVFDCGLGCGIPSVVHFSSNVDTKYLSEDQSIFTKLLLKPLDWIGGLSKTIGVKVNQGISVALGGVMAGFKSGNNMIKNLQLRTIPGITTDIAVTSNTVVTPGTPTVPGATTTTVKAIPVSKTRLVSYEGYIKGTSKTYRFVPNVTDNTIFTSLQRKVSAGGLSSLDAAERIDLADVLGRGTFDKVNSSIGGVRPKASSFSDALRNSVDTTSRPGTTGTSNITRNVNKVDAVTRTKLTDDLVILKGKSDDIGRQITSLKNNNVNVLTGHPSKKKLAQLKSLQDQKKAIDKLIKNSNDVLAHADDVSDDLIDAYRKSAGSAEIGVNKVGNFAAGFIKGIACTVLGNVAGNAAMSALEKGTLINSMTFNTNVNVFEKNNIYSVEIVKGEDNKFVLTLNKSDPKEMYAERLDDCLVKKNEN